MRSHSPPLEGRGRGGVCNILSQREDTDPTPNPSPTREGSGCAQFSELIEIIYNHYGYSFQTVRWLLRCCCGNLKNC